MLPEAERTDDVRKGVGSNHLSGYTRVIINYYIKYKITFTQLVLLTTYN